MGEAAVLPGVHARAARRHAILCVLGASAAFSVSGALVKAVAPVVPTAEITFFRSFVALLAILPLIWRAGGLAVLRTRRPLGHLGRTIAGFCGMYSSFYALTLLPLATVTALGFAMPLVLTLLSIPLLGERIGTRRLLAVLAGLLGVLVVVRPWPGQAAGTDLYAVGVVLAGVVCWALAMISIRRMGEVGERNVTIVAWFSIGSALISLVLAVPGWVRPAPLELAGLVGVGLVSALAQMLMTEGYRSGEASMVAPFEYGAILYATVLGLAIWGEVPDAWGIAGAAIIIVAGLDVWRRETKR